MGEAQHPKWLSGVMFFYTLRTYERCWLKKHFWGERRLVEDHLSLPLEIGVQQVKIFRWWHSATNASYIVILLLATLKRSLQ